MADAKSKGLVKKPSKTTDKDRQDVLIRVKELSQWDDQKVEAFCTEHNFDSEKIQQGLNERFEGTLSKSDDWQVKTKKEPKLKKTGPKTEGTTPAPSGPRESPRAPRTERDPRSPRDNREGGRGGDSKRTGTGGRDGRGGRGGGSKGGAPREARGGAAGARAGGSTGQRKTDNRPATATATTTSAAPAAAQVGFEQPTQPEAWGGDSNTTAQPEPSGNVEAWATPAATPAAAVVSTPSPFTRPPPQPAAEPLVRQPSWAERVGGDAKRAAKELKMQDAFPPQQRLGMDNPSDMRGVPAVVHVQQPVRWGPKKPETAAVVEPAEPSMALMVDQTASLNINSFQDGQFASPNQNLSNPVVSSPVLGALPVSQAPSSESQSSFSAQPEAFQATPESFQQSSDNSFQMYPQSNAQAQVPPSQSSQADQKAQSGFSQAESFPSSTDHRPQPTFAGHENKLVIDMLSTTNNSVILPPQTPTVQMSEFVTFGNFVQQQPQAASFSPKTQPEPSPAQALESKPVQQQTPVEQVPPPQEVQSQHSQPAFNSSPRDTASAPKATPDSSFSSSGSNSQFQNQTNQQYNYPSQQQQPLAAAPPNQGYRGQAPHVYEPSYYPAPYGYPPNEAHYFEFAGRDNQQAYHSSYDFGYGRRRPGNTPQAFYPPPANRGSAGGSLLSNGAPDSSGGSPPSGEPVSPNSAKSQGFKSNFPASKPAFPNANNGKISQPQMQYNKPPATTSSSYKPPLTPTQPPKGFKIQPAPQQQQLHHQEHFMSPYPAGLYGGFPYFSYPGSQPPGYIPHPSVYGFDPRTAGYYPYPGPATAQSFDDYGEYSKQPTHGYSEAPRASGEWSQSSEVNKGSNATTTPSNSANGLPSSMASAKSSVSNAPKLKQQQRQYEQQPYEQDAHYNYPFAGATPAAGSPMAMHASAPPYQPSYPMQAHYVGGQYDHSRYANPPGAWP